MTQSHTGIDARLSLDLRSALERTLGTGFRIDRELGGGGMSRVFLATDLSLDRQVVVKVLSPELSVGVSAERFRREIQLVAKLQHPHVVPLLSAGDADGALYYVMPFISGEPLRAHIAREGPMNVNTVVRILRETLDALAFAHSHGVIHRDMKPDNILIGAGHAVVADFGVSKALQDSSSLRGELTSVGIALGTPAYMAPEQAVADPTTDHRADLYAVGVVAYEMLTGAPPFSGTPSQLFKAHLADAPASIKQRRSDIPDALADLIMRALEKDPALRPQSAAEMVAVLDGVTTPAGTLAAASVAVPTATAANPATSPLRRLPKAVLIGALGAAIIGVAASMYAARSPVIKSAQSLAITPFAVADGDTALVRLGQNLVTTMSANLDGVGEIRVADGTSVLSHAKAKGTSLSVQDAVDIAGKLGALSAVHGTLTRAGELVRADAALYDVASPATPVVRISVTASVDDISALTDSLTWSLLREVWAKGRAPTPNASSIDTRSPVALREFLEGERLFARTEHVQASEHYARAVAADTTFWFAHYRYWLSRSWWGNPSDTSIVNRLLRHVDSIKVPERLLVSTVFRARSLTERIRQLNEISVQYPGFVEVQMSLADIYTHDAMRAGYEPREALEPWRRVAAMMPADLNAANHILFVCMSLGDVACAKDALAKYDAILQADSAAKSVLARGVRDVIAFALSGNRDRMGDSLLRAYPKDSLFWLFMGFDPLRDAPLLSVLPDLSTDLEKLRRHAADPASAGGLSLIPLNSLVNAIRGDLAASDSLPAVARYLPPFVRGTLDLTLAPVAVLVELQGLRDPSRATATAALRTIGSPGLSRQATVERRWIAAVSGLLRKDSAMVRTQVAELRSDTTRYARIAMRSIRALGLGFSGNTAAAGESLLVLERMHGDSTGKVWGAFAADRLLGAQWLTEHGKPAAADSLLRFTQGWAIAGMAGAAYPIAGAAHLQRSRIAESMGNRDKAVEYSRIFLAAYDLPSPRAKAWVDEAKARIKRLGGTVDNVPATTVPLRRKPE